MWTRSVKCVTMQTRENVGGFESNARRMDCLVVIRNICCADGSTSYSLLQYSGNFKKNTSRYFPHANENAGRVPFQILKYLKNLIVLGNKGENECGR